MATYVNRVREVIAAESDDYFDDDTILFNVNKTQEEITSFLIQQEQESNKSLRALDALRQHTDVSVNGLTFTDEGNYYTAEVQFPSSPDEVNQFVSLKYDQVGIMRELSQNNRIKLEWGNLRPTQFESYYIITQDDSDNVIFQIFTEEDDTATSKNVRIYQILNPTTIALADESLTELPTRLEKALVYGSAYLSVLQESVTDEIGQNAVQLFKSVYQEQLQINAY